MAILQYREGSIFDATANAITCPVNTVGVMGAGLAFAFRKHFPDFYYHYRRLCRSEQFTEENILIYQPSIYPASLIAAPTKTHWKEPSYRNQIDYITEKLFRYADAQVTKKQPQYTLAIPLLGCGKGGLSFEKEVRPIFEHYQNQEKATIEVWMG